MWSDGCPPLCDCETAKFVCIHQTKERKKKRISNLPNRLKRALMDHRNEGTQKMTTAFYNNLLSAN